MAKKVTEIKNFKDFLIKNTIIASALTFLLGAQIKHLSSTILDALIDPLFSIDLGILLIVLRFSKISSPITPSPLDNPFVSLPFS